MEYAIVPHWFAGYNALLEMTFFVITLLVGAYALKVHRLSGQRQSRLFGISFLLISAAYLVQSILNFAASYPMAEGCSMQSMVAFHSLGTFAVYAHMVLFMTGLVTLAYMTLKIRDFGAYALFLSAMLAVLLLSANKLYFFYVLSSILLVYVSFYYLRNYLKGRKMSALIVFVAFLFLLFGKIHFIFSTDHGAFYVGGHLLEFVAYTLILTNLVNVVRGK